MLGKYEEHEGVPEQQEQREKGMKNRRQDQIGNAWGQIGQEFMGPLSILKSSL